jgi:hypothetical protein
MGAASPRLWITCQMVGGFARIANRVTRPLHSTFPAGSGARAHGLRAKAGAPFLSIFLFTAGTTCRTKGTAPSDMQPGNKGDIITTRHAQHAAVMCSSGCPGARCRHTTEGRGGLTCRAVCSLNRHGAANEGTASIQGETSETCQQSMQDQPDAVLYAVPAGGCHNNVIIIVP